jgi:hypothetical protein
LLTRRVGLESSVLASNLPHDCKDPIRPHLKYLQAYDLAPSHSSEGLSSHYTHGDRRGTDCPEHQAIHELWASIPEAAIGIWLLARQLGVASLVPMVICIISLAAASPIAAKFGPAQRVWVERVERRVAVTACMLGNMKAVKMLGLSGALRGIITQLRVVEMKTSERVRGLFVWQIVVGKCSVRGRRRFVKAC